MVQSSGSRFQGSGFRVQGSGFGVQGSGFRVYRGTSIIRNRVEGLLARLHPGFGPPPRGPLEHIAPESGPDPIS